MTTDRPSHSHTGRDRPVFRMTRAHRLGDALMTLLIRVGLVPHSYLLTTCGRRTNRLFTTPVTLVETRGRHYLVAPYGPVSWVLNTRAAGRVSLGRRGREVDCTVREVGAEEAGPVLKRYVGLARPARPYFDAKPDAPVADFAAEAGRHPVFELTALGGERWP